MQNMHHETVFVEPQIGLTTAKHLTPAGAWLVRHHHVPYNIADYVAELAGLNLLEGRHA
jgi:hypothetical protein